MKSDILVVLFLTVFSCCSYAKVIRIDYPGAELLRECTSAVRVLDGGGATADISLGEDATRCMGYVMGVEGGYLEAKKSAAGFCLPFNTSDFILVRVVQKFLHEHPELLNYAAANLEIKALKEAFPCSKK